MVRYGFTELVDVVARIILSVWTSTGSECDALDTAYEVAIHYSADRDTALRVIDAASTSCGFQYP
jgi:hypothetical protein